MLNWFTGVWRDARLTIDIEEHGHDKLTRDLGLFSIFLFTVTQAVGAGILTTPGIIANSYAGPNAWLSFLYAGLICAAPALCLAKLATSSTRSGSTGSYASMHFGQLIGLLMFVDVAMECIGGTAAVAVSQAEHIKLALDVSFGWELPAWFSQTPSQVNWTWLLLGLLGLLPGALICLSSYNSFCQAPAKMTARVLPILGLLAGMSFLSFGIWSVSIFVLDLQSINLLSLAVVLIATTVLMRGIGETKKYTIAFTLVKLLVIGVVVFLLAGHYDAELLKRPVSDGMPGILAGASLAFFAYVGLDMVTTAAGETRNPKRNVPLGMLLGLLAVIALYVTATYFLCAAVPYEQLSAGGKGSAAPMAKALEILGYKSATVWVTVGSTIALFSVLLAGAYSTTRLLFNMAQHRIFPELFEKVNARGVPVVATLAVGGAIGVLTALLDVDELMHLTNIGTMTCFCTASAIVLVSAVGKTDWRVRQQALKGAFWLLVSTLGVLGPLRLMVELPATAFWRLGVVWLLVILYFVFWGRHRSLARLQQVNPG